MKAPAQKSNPKQRAKAFPKGRQVDINAINDLKKTFNDAPFERDLLIEYLHTINDKFGYLSPQHIQALASLMGLAQIDVYETARFYAHFSVLTDHETPPPPITLRICDGPTCRMTGAKTLLKEALSAFSNQVNVVSAPCVGACDTPPAALLGKNRILNANMDTIGQDIQLGHTAPKTSFPSSVFAPASPKKDAHIIEILDQAGLRGCGGAGFPTAQKWRFFNDAPHPRVLVVNADEGEPGTFKDRYLFENHMDQVLAGICLAAQTLEVQDVYVYLRDEYPHIHQALKKILPTLKIQGVRFHLRRGAGAYVCGEETSLIESLEGKRGLPRNRPPYPAQNGFMGRPTITQNVETLYWIAEIVEHGVNRYIQQQRPRFYSVSGRIRQPGVFRAPSTATVTELIEAADGMIEGHLFTAFLPGGASGGIFPASFADKAMNFGVFEEFGGFVGSGALTILSNHDDVWDVARTLSQFFADESCGQCTPCRVGTQKIIALLNNAKDNEKLIRELATTMGEASICGLGQAAANPVITLFNHGAEKP